MRVLPRVVAWGVVLLACALSAPGSARAAPPAGYAAKPRSLADTLTGSAKADYIAGKAAFQDGDTVGARIKFQAAYDLTKDPRLLWNIATCLKAERHYARVIALLRRYVAEGGALLSPADVKDAQDLIVALTPFTAKVTVTASEAGAEVSVDGEPSVPVTTTPLVLDVGERRIRVTKGGFAPFETTYLVSGTEGSVVAKLAPVVHEGRLTVNAPSNATILLDEAPFGVGRVDRVVPAGSHALRITAPGMRPYKGDVVIVDKESRTLEITLEAVELPRLRLGVGCGDDTPRGPDDGVVVYLDGNDVVPPSGVKKSWDPKANDNVFRYAEYPAAAGPHTLRVRATGCLPAERSITVDPVDGDEVNGVLALDTNVLLRGPQGTPGFFRAGAAFWLPTVIGKYNLAPDDYTGSPGSLAGVAVDVGLVRRWFQADLSFAYAAGSLSRSSFASTYALPSSPSADVVRGMLRLGPRFPFNVVSLGLGFGVGLEQLNVDGVKTGGVDPTLGPYVELVVQPFCSFGFFAMGEATADFASTNSGGGNDVFGLASLQIGGFYGPSPSCTRERGTAFGLTERAVHVQTLTPPSSRASPASPAPLLAPPSPPPPAVEDVASRLRKLKALYDGKAITEDEYKKERERILKEGGL